MISSFKMFTLLSVLSLTVHAMDNDDIQIVVVPLKKIHKNEKENFSLEGLSVDEGGYLDLSKRNLISCRNFGSLSIPKLTKVAKLILSNNEIERFDFANLRKVMPNLCHLDVSYNQIKKLRASMLRGLPTGGYLNLSYNPIEKLGDGIENAISNLRGKKIEVSLYNTNLSDCVLESLEKSIENNALHHTIIREGFFVLGAVLLVSGVVMLANSMPVEVSESNESCELIKKTTLETALRLGGISMIIPGMFMICPRMVIKIFQDMRKSRLYWRKIP